TGEHLLAHRVREQWHHVIGVQTVNGQEQQRRQSQQNDAGQAAFARQGLYLTPNLESFADQVADLVENFGKVTTRLPLQNHRRGKELHVQVGNPLGHRVERLVERNTQVLLLEDATKFLADRQRHLFSNQPESGGKAMACSQGA